MKETKHTKKHAFGSAKKAIVAVAVTALACVGVTGALAFFTDTDTTTNEFTVAEQLAVEVEEPNWTVPTDPVVPGQTVTKDPSVLNRTTMAGGEDAWMFMQVDIPTANVKTVNGATVSQAADTELFSMNGIDTTHWTQVGSKVLSGDKATTTYIYAYNTKVAPTAKTTSLFTSVTLANLADGQTAATGKAANIVVTGYGIQATGFATPTAAWSAYKVQNGIA